MTGSHKDEGKEALDVYLGSIRGCLDKGLHYAAIVVALTVPEICGALESESGWGGEKIYLAWCAKYLEPSYPELSAIDFYKLRCGVVHQGKFGKDGMTFSRVIFGLPIRNGVLVHSNIINDALNLDADRFCEDIIAAAKKWYANNTQNPHVIKNLPNLVRYRPEGLSPYVGGIPVIA